MDEHSYQERLDIDPRFHGVWYLQATSVDGEEMVHSLSKTPFCRVFATKVRMDDGREATIDRVLSCFDEFGNVVNTISFMNASVIWRVTDLHPNISRGVLLQIFWIDDLSQEKGRAVCTVRI